MFHRRSFHIPTYSLLQNHADSVPAACHRFCTVGAFQSEQPFLVILLKMLFMESLLMALFFLLTVPLCVAVFVEDKYEDPPACHLLQTGLSLKASRHRSDWQAESKDRNASVKNGICFPNLTQDLVTAPMREVTAKYDEDGFCVFGKDGLWSSGCAVTRREHSAFHYVNQFKDYYPAVLNVSWATPFTLHLYDNRSLTIRMHAYPLDARFFQSTCCVFQFLPWKKKTVEGRQFVLFRLLWSCLIMQLEIMKVAAVNSLGINIGSSQEQSSQ